MGEVQDDDPSGFDGYEQTFESQTILEIARAFREEFGVGIDAHPGGEGNVAGVVNRAYRTAARLILGAVVMPKDDTRPPCSPGCCGRPPCGG